MLAVKISIPQQKLKEAILSLNFSYGTFNEVPPSQSKFFVMFRPFNPTYEGTL
jgi:hypothetical protein